MKIEVEKKDVRATRDEQVVVDVTAALYREPEAGQGRMRVPGITFEIRTLLGRAVGISSDRGLFDVKDLLLVDGQRSMPPSRVGKLLLSAHYNEEDEVFKVTEEVEIDISAQLQEIEALKRERIERENAKLAQEMRARQQAKEADERKRLERERYERLAPDRKRAIKSDITKAGEDIVRGRALQLDPFNVLREYSEHPHAERIALAVAAQQVGAKRAVEAVQIYKSASWAGEVMKIAAALEPRLVIENISKYKDMYWASEVIIVAARMYPKAVVKSLSIYCDYPWCETVIKNLAHVNPQAVFEEVEMWEFYPWAEEVAMLVAERAPEFVINNFDLYQDQAWAGRVYGSVVKPGRFSGAERAEAQRVLKKKINDTGLRLCRMVVRDGDNDESRNGPKELPEEGTRGMVRRDFAFLCQHRFHFHTELMMYELASLNPKICIENIDMYKSAPWAQGVMEVATEKLPGASIAQIENFIEMPWASAILMIAAIQQPRLVIRSLPKFASYRWSLDVVRAIAVASPASIFGEIEYIEFQEWAEEVVSIAGMKSPAHALQVRSRYASQPWSTRVVLAVENEHRLALAHENVKQETKDDSNVENNESKKLGGITRRKVLAGVLGVLGLTIPASRWWDRRKFREMGWNIDDIVDSPDQILPRDIKAAFSEETLEHIFEELDPNLLFEKYKDGSYNSAVYQQMKEVMYRLRDSVYDGSRSKGEPRLSFGKLEMVDDGLMKAGLEVQEYDLKYHESYETGIIFKDYHPGWTEERKAELTEIPDWLIIDLKRRNGIEGAFDVSIYLKPTIVRPIRESIKFVLNRGVVSDLVHRVEINYGVIGSLSSEVVYSDEGQRAIKTRRREAARKKL